MDVEVRDIIAKQTGLEDLLHIEKVYFECKQDVGATILNLMNVKYVERPKPAETKFDEIRRIVDEKDAIFQELRNNQ